MEQSIFKKDVVTTALNSVLSTMIYHHNQDEMWFDETYQRPYVWGQSEQQALLKTIFNSEPIDSVSVTYNKDSITKYIEVIDGRQRITTVCLFVDNKIPYIFDEKKIYFKDLSKTDQKEFLATKLPLIEVNSSTGAPLTLKQKIAYFYRKNFSGLPQSAKHKTKIEAML